MAIKSSYIEADMGTVLTIAPGMSWIGSLQLSVGGAPTSASPYIEVQGGGVGVLPAVGTKVLAAKVTNQVPAVNVINPLIYLEAGDAALTLRLVFNGASNAIGIANGYEAGVPA